MIGRLIRSCSVFVIALFCSAVSAQTTFNYSVTCTGVTIGPIAVDSFSPGSTSGSVTLTPNVLFNSSALAILSFSANVVNVSNTVTSGSFSGLLPCMLTFGGVTVNFTRPLSLTVTPSGTNCGAEGFAGGCLTFGAATATVNLGAQGTVVISASFTLVAGGYDASKGIGIPRPVTPVPFDTALLTPVAPPATPLPPTFVLVLTGLAGAGLYQVRRKFARA
jgi:hypothetical protein